MLNAFKLLEMISPVFSGCVFIAEQIKILGGFGEPILGVDM